MEWDKERDEVFKRVNDLEQETTTHGVKIDNIEDDVDNIKDHCDSHPEVCLLPSLETRVSKVETIATGVGTSLDTLKRYILPILAVGNIVLNLVAVGVLTIVLFGIKSDVAQNSGKFDTFIASYTDSVRGDATEIAKVSVKLEMIERRITEMEKTVRNLNR